MSLPISPATESKNVAPPPTEGTRILVVDDNADTTMLLEFALKRRGRDVVTAASVAEAMELVMAQSFDLIVSDIGLRDGTGLDLMRQIQAVKPTRGIALSGRGGPDDVDESRAAGFEVHLIKPVSLDKLEAAVARLLGSATI
jgi:CheY-like chemotaxis protein